MKTFQLAFSGIAAAGILSLSMVAPASADGAASTRNIILGAAAIAGIAIESNIARKNAQANAITGYLPDGSRVYGDGHVVARDGSAYYPGHDGRHVSCGDGRCNIAYVNVNTGGHHSEEPNNGSSNGRYDGNLHSGGPHAGNADDGNDRGDSRTSNDPHRWAQ